MSVCNLVHISQFDLRCGYLLLDFSLVSYCLVSYHHDCCCVKLANSRLSYVLIGCLLSYLSALLFVASGLLEIFFYGA